MHAKYPNAFVVSLTLHGFVAALIFVTTVYVARQEAPPVIFELVAGPPTAPDELVAPALGNTVAPVKAAEPVAQPQPAPPVQETVQNVAPPVEVAPAEALTPAKPKDVAKPKPDISMTKQMKQSQKTSYRDYLKKHPTPKPSPATTAPKTANVPRIDAQGIANGVKGGSTANTRGGGGGKALTREEQSEENTYISFLLNALKEAHEPPPGVSDQLEAKVTFDITASGSILNPKISKSSGDRAFDESVLEAFRRVKSIGPTPNGKADTWTVTFRMKD
jgi:TonB family protein